MQRMAWLCKSFLLLLLLCLLLLLLLLLLFLFLLLLLLLLLLRLLLRLIHHHLLLRWNCLLNLSMENPYSFPSGCDWFWCRERILLKEFHTAITCLYFQSVSFCRVDFLLILRPSSGKFRLVLFRVFQIRLRLWLNSPCSSAGFRTLSAFFWGTCGI